MMRRVLPVALVLAWLVLASTPALAQQPATLTVVTEPRQEGVEVTIDGTAYTTNRFGRVVVPVEAGEHQVSVAEMQQIDDSTRVLFARWHDLWTPSRPIRVSTHTTMTLGLYIQHAVTFDFRDGLGEPLPLDRIESVQILNSNGDRFTFSAEAEEDGAGTLEGAWFTANRIRRTGAGLNSKPQVYVFQRIYVDGIDAVQRSAVDYLVEPEGEWEVTALVFPLEIEVRSFGLNRTTPATLELRNAESSDSATALEVVAPDGLATVPQLPIGDYEVSVIEGGLAPATPIIFTGPKTEHLTVLTSGLAWTALALVVLFAISAILFVRRRRWRLPMLLGWAALGTIALSVPSLGAVVNRPLSATAQPIYTANGDFLGMEMRVVNEAPVTIAQIYCKPDFELRVITGGQVWTATYESHDFHDVEMGECREHRVAPGVSHVLLSPQEGQEWSLQPGSRFEPGVYDAYVRIFDIPAEPVTLNLRKGLAEDLRFIVPDTALFNEVPYTSPFED